MKQLCIDGIGGESRERAKRIEIMADRHKQQQQFDTVIT